MNTNMSMPSSDQTSDFEIRPFYESDFPALGAFYKQTAEERRVIFWWVGDCSNWPNVICAFEHGKMIAKGQVDIFSVMPSSADRNNKHRIFFNLKTLPERSSDTVLLGAVYHTLYERALELKRQLPDTHGALLCFGNYAEETENTGYFTDLHGFFPLNKQFRMHRDLSAAEPIGAIPLPEEYTWRIFDTLTEKQTEEYLALDLEIWPETPIGVKRLLELSSQPNWRLLRIEADGETAAGLMYWIEDGNVGAIEEVFTREPYRRRGLASALLTRALEELREAGCEEVELDVETLNDSALHLYTSAGFSIVTEERRYGIEL
ncbi:GNAT family N-acetyltransferase [Saccharibacillus kuerlensis]|uniref:N-acetyltransferase domain-containing protein n=1 Tax=Saccharibacillus kuerlensis TaxID=459527 RepID=A0ABQ2L4Q3_9BACL|nr:GNAT family N-acetyltransferase [Saccharibacillus kuerlensis]GGO03144.1 hypothetical protein GCM10010969_27140 [Saccharibacillus kuerlensis]